LLFTLELAGSESKKASESWQSRRFNAGVVEGIRGSLGVYASVTKYFF